MCAVITNGFLLTYGVPPFLRLVNSSTFKPSKAFNLGWMSKPAAAIGVAYCLFSIATIALPAFVPVTAANMNYAPVALGAVVVGLGGLLDPRVLTRYAPSTYAGSEFKKPAAAAGPEGMEDSAHGGM